ncbi:MAG: class I SAM-dependent methyltransferase [Thiothrix sp.]
MQQARLFTQGWDDYELLDVGNGKKLERWGRVVTIRPEINAYFQPGKPYREWQAQAHWVFHETNSHSGAWQALQTNAPQRWEVCYRGLHFQLVLTRFKHVGLFPEQRTNWDFLREHLPDNAHFLNLFAYTGAASCVARYKGAETVHVDSVKALLTWANTNMQRSGLSGIRWIHDDALKFVERELKRGRHYHAIVMDPPAWGLGAQGERWKLETRLAALLEGVQGLLTQDGFLIVNTYSPRLSLAELTRMAQQCFPATHCHSHELWMRSSTGKELYYGNVLRVCKP